MQAGSTRRCRRLLIGLATATAAILPATAFAATVTPTVLGGAGNEGKECKDLYGPNVYQLKVEGAVDSGTYPDDMDMLTVTVVRPSSGSTNQNSFDWTSNIDLVGVVVKDGVDGANWYDYSSSPTKGNAYLTTPFDGDKAISHISFCYYEPPQDIDPPLSVVKTAVGSFTRTVTWTLDKSVDDAEHSGYAGQVAGASTWTVVADKTETYGDYRVAGTITITNVDDEPRGFRIVSDTLDTNQDLTSAVVCPANTVPASTGGTSGSITCSYGATTPSSAATLNSVVVYDDDLMANLPPATDTIEWTERLDGYDSGTLSDPRFEYSETISGDTTETFPETFICPADTSLYDGGTYAATQTNTAVLDSNIGLSDSADVRITCTLLPLVPSKVASGSYTRSVTWTLTKTVDDDSHSGYAGQVAGASTWTVTADKTETEHDFSVTGTISIYNPSAVTQTFTVSDQLDDGTVATVTCPDGGNTGEVAGGLTVVCAYTAEPEDRTATLNTATVALSGNPTKTATAEVTWDDTLDGYDSGTLRDGRFDYSKTISGDTTETFPETFTCPAVKWLYDDDGLYSQLIPNDAYLDGGIGLMAWEDVKVDCYWPTISLTKTGDELSKKADTVYYDITLTNQATTSVALPDLSCSLTDETLGFTKSVTLASGAIYEETDLDFTIPNSASDPFINEASATCTPVGSDRVSATASASWSTNLFQPSVEIVKTGPSYATSGSTITYEFTINNLSSTDAPTLALQSITDTKLGDLSDEAPAACDALAPGGSCTFTKDFLVPDEAPTTISNVVTVHYKPLGFPNDITDDDDHTVTVTPGSQLTNTSFCPLPNNQFRLLYQLEVAPNTYRLQASNPGQYYFNGFYLGTPGSDVTMALQVPWPFVTQENIGNPIQVHDGTGLTEAGCYVPNPSLSGFTITTPASIPTSAAGNQIITPEDFTTKNLGSYTTVTVEGKMPATGFLYVTIHLDYGLKKTGSWTPAAPGTYNPTTGSTLPDMANGPVTIKGVEPYTFSRTVGGGTATVHPESCNEVKKFAGFTGFTIAAATEQPIPNAKVLIYSPKGVLLTTQYTDDDGYYLFAYKHTAKVATYTVKLPAYGKSTSVTVRANGFAAVNFDV
jgi:hypothetical protein